MMNIRMLLLVGMTSSSLLFTACSTLKSSASAPIPSTGRWVLLPAINNTETPQAGGRLDSITTSLLYTHGIKNLSTYPAANQAGDSLFDSADRRSQEEALVWAKKQP